MKMFGNFLLASKEKYMIIQGSAGTGKSTLTEYLIKSNIVEKQMNMLRLVMGKNKNHSDFEIHLTATTNKAAAVLSQLTNMDATTIHNLLKLTVRSNVSTGTVELTKKKDFGLLHNKLIIIDEASMMNDELFEILEEVTINCKVVLIGDKYQLAPVRQKIPVMDDIQCTTATLHKVMRHAGNILTTSSDFRDVVESEVWCNVPNLPELQMVNGQDFQDLVDQAFTDKMYNSSTAKILAWTNKRVLSYNAYVRKLRGLPDKLQVGETVYTNKPIMLGRNNWPTDSRVRITGSSGPTESYKIKGRMIELDNRCSAFLPDSHQEAKAIIKDLASRKQWRTYFEIKEGWLDLRPAFASTVHKAQGATYRTVFIDLADIGRCNIKSDVARMMYVAISRAANQIYFYGDLPTKYKEAV